MAQNPALIFPDNIWGSVGLVKVSFRINLNSETPTLTACCRIIPTEFSTDKQLTD